MRKLKDLIDTVTERGYYVSEAYRLQKDVDSLSRRVRDYYGVPVGTYMGTPMLFAMLRSEPVVRRRVAKCRMYLQTPAEVEEQQRISAPCAKKNPACATTSSSGCSRPSSAS